MKINNEQISSRDFTDCGDAIRSAIVRMDKALAYDYDRRSSRLLILRDVVANLSRTLAVIDRQDIR